MQVEITPKEFKPSLCQNHCIEHEDNFIIKLQKALKEPLKKEGFVKYDLKVKQIDTNGGNYLGELYEVEAIEMENEKKITMFVKKTIKGDKMLLLPVNQAHGREIFFYKEVNRIFTELQEEANIPMKERYRVVKSYDVNDPDLLILDNLAKSGYRTYGRMEVISLQYAEMSIEQMAKFHALSFVMEKKRPEYFKSKIATKTHLYTFDRAGGWDNFLKKIGKSTLQYLDGRNKEGLMKYLPGMKERLRTLVMDTSNYRSCLCHGDWRPNNIMMTEVDGIMTDVITIDYQIMYYGNQINDFLFFIFGSTDQNFRKLHLEYLKDLYFAHFEDNLKLYEIDVEEVYPRKEFEKDYKERLDYGLIIFLIQAPFLYAPDDDIPDFEKELETLNFAIVDAGRDRINGVIEDFVKWGYL